MFEKVTDIKVLNIDAGLSASGNTSPVDRGNDNNPANAVTTLLRFNSDNTTGAATLKLQHRDDSGDAWVDVPTSLLITGSDTTYDFATEGVNIWKKVAYVAGLRYCRIALDPSTADGTVEVSAMLDRLARVPD